MDQPEMIPGTEDSRNLVHPMWEPPSADDLRYLNGAQRALRQEIARRLTPFDGRPNSEMLVDFCKAIYLESGETDCTALLGRIAFLRYQHSWTLKKEASRLAEAGWSNPRLRDRADRYQEDAATIERLGDSFTFAICQSVYR